MLPKTWPILLSSLLLAGCIGRDPPSLFSDDPARKIPAMKTLGQHDAKSNAELVKDLDSDDPAIRFYAIQTLQRLTGQTLDYRYYDDEVERIPALKRWQGWLAGQAGNPVGPATTRTADDR
jgi:hypothetical protein